MGDFSFGNMLKGLGSWLGSPSTAENVKNATGANATGANFGESNALKLLGYGGALWGAYNQQKQAKKMFDLQKQAFDFNKMLSNRQLERENMAQQNLNDAFNASLLAKKRKDDENEYVI